MARPDDFPEIAAVIKARIDKISLNKDVLALEMLESVLNKFQRELNRLEIELLREQNEELREANQKDEDYIKTRRQVRKIVNHFNFS